MALINGTAGSDVLNGTLGNDEINGLAGDDKLYGNRGSDVLNGGAGKDILRGDNGDDTLDGGAGADDMNGGAGNDTYIVDNVGDVTKESSNDAESGINDSVEASITYTLGFGFENLFLTGSTAINGTGNANGNNLFGNNADNVLMGLAGEDLLLGASGNDLLNGGTGADYMDGGDGSDTYIVDNAGDTVEENYIHVELEGIDTVKASVSHTLSYGIENLILTSSTAINGTGNRNKNVMIGNSANNVLSGLDGNDHLHAGNGKDTLKGGNGNDLLVGESGADTQTGGAGTDIFRYKSVSDSPAGTGKDVLTDFKGNGSAAGDQIDLKAIDANILKSGAQAFTWKGATPGGAGTLWYSGGVLSANIDNDAAVEFQIKVELNGSPAPLHVTDIVL